MSWSAEAKRLACLGIEATGAIEMLAIQSESLACQSHSERERSGRTVIGPDVAMPGFERAIMADAPEPG